MKKMALLHTVQSVADTFGAYLLDGIDSDVKVYNLWDQMLSLGPNDEGGFTIVHKNRLYRDLKNCEETGADLIVVSCSTLTPHLDDVRPFLHVPLIAIDDAMLETAAKEGKDILLAATAGSAMNPAVAGLEKESGKAGTHPAHTEYISQAAYEKLQQNDMTAHDAILREEVIKEAGKQPFDLIVLCQASMAPCAPDIEKATGIKTLSSPLLCRRRVAEFFEKA